MEYTKIIELLKAGHDVHARDYIAGKLWATMKKSNDGLISLPEFTNEIAEALEESNKFLEVWVKVND